MPQNGCDRNCMTKHTDAKMPHFKGEKEMGHFGIGMHIHASGLSLSQPFWGILATLVYFESLKIFENFTFWKI